MQVSILGPVEVTVDGRPVTVGGSRVRRLLTRLALEAGRPVGQPALAEAVWGETVPAEVPNALQSLVSRLRRALGDPALVVATPAGGYRLAVLPEGVDAECFERDVKHAAAVLAADPAAALVGAQAALAQWRGEPLADLDGDAADADVARLGRLHDRAVDVRLEALVRTGQAAAALDELAARVEADPTDERATGLLMTALASVGRPADALATYDRTRKALGDTLGTDPSPQLQDTYLELLRRDSHPATAVARGNLPTPVSSLLGRDADLPRIGEMLRQSRLVTLVGPGGSGKTRLAIEAARLVTDRMPGGVWFVELARITDPADVPTAVVDAVGAWDAIPLDRTGALTQRAAPVERLEAALRGTPTLLVLDNCEHVVDAAAELADRLLNSCPQLSVLATSREPLAVGGELLAPVPPLAHETDGLGLDELAGVPAVALFVDRATAADPAFRLTVGNAGAVAEIARRLDGLPLALELAAARSRTLPVAQIAERLDDRFRLLTGGSRTALPRHRTLRAVVEWSWGLLSDRERDLMERLAVFPAGITPEAARFVVQRSGGDAHDADELSAALVDKSLLQLRDGPRYRMLETLREFGLDRLSDRDAIGDARETHAAYFLQLVDRLAPLLRGRDQMPAIALTVAERDNVLAALQFWCDRGEADRAVSLAVGVAWFWTLRNEHGAAATWLRRAVDVPGGTWNADRVIAVGLLAMNVGASDGDEKGRALVETYAGQLRAPSAVGDPPLLLVTRAFVPVFLGSVEEARDRVAQGLAVTDDPWARGTLHTVQSFAEENAGDLEAMRRSVDAAHREFEALGERFGLAGVLESRGRLLAWDGDLNGALVAFAQSARIQTELGADSDFGQTSLWQAQVHIRRGDLPAAEAAVAAARDRFERVGFWLGLVLVDAAASLVARERGDWPQALELALSAERAYAERPDLGGPLQLLAICLHAQALALISDGQLARAREVLRRARDEAQGSSDMPVVAMVAVGFAVLAQACGDLGQAAALLGAADAIRGGPDRAEPDVVRVQAAIADDPALLRRRRQAGDAGRGEALALLDSC